MEPFWGQFQSRLWLYSGIISVDSSRSLAVKYADDTALSTHRSKNYDRSDLEVNASKKWAIDNQMTIQLSKTKELIVRGKSEASLP